MIRVAELEVRRNGKLICRVDDLEVREGERLGVVGPNGSGKSTLFKVLAGLDDTATGQCDVAAPMQQRVYVHQQPFLFKGTILSNAAYGLRSHGKHGATANQVALEWLERLGVAHLADRAGDGLSGGEKRRVALARAMALRPRLLLLDEPLADLDADGAALVTSALAELSESTVLVAGPVDLAEGLVTRTHLISTADAGESR